VKSAREQNVNKPADSFRALSGVSSERNARRARNELARACVNSSFRCRYLRALRCLETPLYTRVFVRAVQELSCLDRVHRAMNYLVYPAYLISNDRTQGRLAAWHWCPGRVEQRDKCNFPRDSSAADPDAWGVYRAPTADPTVAGGHKGLDPKLHARTRPSASIFGPLGLGPYV